MSSMNRRNFLAASAATAAAVVVKNAPAQSALDTINVALIGSGEQCRYDTMHLLAVTATRLAAVCDINPQSVAKVQKLLPQWSKHPADFRVYQDYRDMLAKEPDVDAVIIGLPEHIHADAAIAAMRAGKDVFCEKPMAYTLEQSRAMLQARDETRRILQIGQQRRSNPVYFLAERLLNKKGLCGEILRVDAFWDRWEDWKRPLPPDLAQDFGKWGYPTLNHLINWRLYRKYGHGLMTENGTHQLDVVNWMLGKRPKVCCGVGVRRYDDRRETHDIASAEYVYDGDIVVRFCQDFHQGFNFNGKYGEVFLGREGALRIGDQWDIVFYPKRRKGERIGLEQLGDLAVGGVIVSQKEIDEHYQNRNMAHLSYAVEMRAFAHAVRNRTPVPCSGEMGHNAIVPTIVASEAQFEQSYKHFEPKLFA